MSDDRLSGLGDMIRSVHEGTAQAVEIYEALRTTGELRHHRAVTVRCEARRCLLLDVIETPAGLIAHQPRYKLSPEVNPKQSNDSGRAANTEDGDRRWKGHTYPIELAMNFVLNCDHVLSVTFEMTEVEEAIASGRRLVMIH